MKQKKHILKILISTLTIILLSALIILIIFVTINYIKNIKKDIQTTEQEVIDQYERINLQKKSISELAEVRDNAELLKQSIVNKENIVNIIEQLENLAISQNILVNLNNTSQQENNFVFSFKLTTTFNKTLQYLNSLENLPFYILIDKLNWTKADAENVSLSFEATIPSK